MNHSNINGIRVFSFSSHDDLINYVEKEKKSLIAINAEKILHVTKKTRTVIN
jgi:UDP-N-acetyl-D-mannosaminouronate:lipid I N-acetyl-D-mannosaminouronosyltransferase